MTRFHDQMKEAREAENGRIIRDYPSWTLDDYRDFMFCVEKGYLVQKESSTLFMINPEWEGADIYAETCGDMKCEDCGDEGSVSGSPDGKLCPDCYDKKAEEKDCCQWCEQTDIELCSDCGDCADPSKPNRCCECVG